MIQENKTYRGKQKDSKLPLLLPPLFSILNYFYLFRFRI